MPLTRVATRSGLGEFADEATAAREAGAIGRLGFDSPSVVREATTVAGARGFLLIGGGSPPVRIDSRKITAAPSSPDGFIELDSRPYRGYLEIALNKSSSLTAINVVNLEDYLRGVVPAELSPDAFPEKEALKAQAIAARTYAVKRRGQFAADGYDLCATPACQVYRGVAVERPLSNAAVSETAGEVLTFGGEPVDALYTSTCGGRTESSENVFSEKEPYLVSRACFLEARAPVVASAGGAPLTLEAAVLRALGCSEPGEEGRELSYPEARTWLASVLRLLGQSPCWSEPAASDSARVLDLPALAGLLNEGLCWDRRLPFLFSDLDANRIVGGDLPEADRLRLAYAIRSGLIVPDGSGVRMGQRVSRQAVMVTLHRLLTQRGEPLLKEGRIRQADAAGLTIVEAAESTETSMALAPSRRFFREIAGASYYASELTLLPNDRVRYRASDEGIDILVLLEDGGSFDRSSRFSHWVVRKSADELSREVNASSQVPVGSVRELRPKRYGASGRIAELEVVGSAGSVTLKGLAIRRALGIRENLFFFDPAARSGRDHSRLGLHGARLGARCRDVSGRGLRHGGSGVLLSRHPEPLLSGHAD